MSTQPHITREDIEHRFGYHRATFPAGFEHRSDKTTTLADWYGAEDTDGNVATAPQHAAIRKEFIEVANKLVHLVPAGREQELMLTALQEAAMWANAGIAMQSPLVRE